jgi:hypothetical protein
MAIVMDTGAAHSVISCDRADTLCLKPTLRSKCLIDTECHPVEVMIRPKTAIVPFWKCSLPTPLCVLIMPDMAQLKVLLDVEDYTIIDKATMGVIATVEEVAYEAVPSIRKEPATLMNPRRTMSS